ncbi:MAG: hypothetical protein J6S44_06255 [Clostridia bacterium]|nr:hypothetical protein [Clostridia bacterium]
MDRTQKLILAVVAVLLAVALVVVVLVAASNRHRQGTFTPPPFEETAVVGTPTVSDETLRYSYAKITDELAVGLCATCERVEDDLLIYFTSLEHNTAWVRVKVYDEKGKLRGESGLLRPGEYVERIPLTSSPKGETLKIKVLSYEPETYYSLGSAELTVDLK